MIVNRLIREAKNGATVLEINPNQVGTVLEHCLHSYWAPTGENRREIMRQLILDGQLRLLGVPIRVRGAFRPVVLPFERTQIR